MKNWLEKYIDRIRVYIWYTVIFGVSAIAIFWMFWHYKESMLAMPDGYLQNYPILVKMYNMIQECINTGNFEFWSWDTGLGGDVIGNYSSFLFDPFSYITFLFGRNRLDFGYAVGIMARLYAAGLAFAIFLRYKKFENWKIILGAISFTFSSWMLNIDVIMHPSFMYVVMLFPLLILGVDKVYNGEKPTTLIISVFALSIYSVYFTFMSGIIIIVYCICCYWEYNEKFVWKKFLDVMLKLAGFAVVGFLMAALILFPTIYALLAASTESLSADGFFFTVKQYITLIPSFFAENSIYGNYSYTSAGILFTLLIPFFVRKKYWKEIQVKMWLVCAVILVFPIFSRMLNGFSYPTGRWMYVMIFFMIWSGLGVLKEEMHFSKRFLVGWFGAIALIFWLSWFVINIMNETSIIVLLINIILSIVFICLLSKNKDLVVGEKEGKKKKQRLIVLVVLLGIVVTNNMKFSVYYSDVFEKTYSVGEFEKKMKKSVQRVGQKINDNEFYRVYQTNGMNNYHMNHWPVNESIYWGNKSIYSYLSTIDAKWFEFNKSLGNSAGYSTRVHVYGNDLRTRLDYLLGVKYFLGDNGLDTNTLDNHEKKDCAAVGYGFDTKELIEDVEVLKNKYSIGLGTVFNKVISRTEFEKLSPMEKEECLMQAAVVEDEDLDRLAANNIVKSDSILTESFEVPYSILEGEKLNIDVGKFESLGGGNTFSINVNDVQNSEIFVMFEGLKKRVLSYEEQKENDLGDNPSKLATSKYDRNNKGNLRYGNFEAIISTNSVKKRIVNYSNTNQALPNIENYCVNLGYYDNYSGNIDFSFATKGEYTFDKMKVIALPVHNYEKQAQNLQNSKLNIEDFQGDYIKGTVDSDENGLLYLSIIKHPGWNIYVDGEKVDKPIYANIAFTGIPISEGKHVIELKYSLVGKWIGISLSGIGIILFLLICLLYRPKKMHIRE